MTQTNTLGIAKGTEIIVGQANSRLRGYYAGFLAGVAYGSLVNIGSVIQSGQTATIYIPCLGTGGKIRDNSLATINIPGVLSSGSIVNTVKGTTNAKSAVNEITSTLQGINIASGLITAEAIKADAQASTDGISIQLSDAGSQFQNLVIAGYPSIGSNVTPNTKVKLAGLGTLWLHRVVKTPGRIEVRMIELVITENNNKFGLPIGANIRAGVVVATIR